MYKKDVIGALAFICLFAALFFVSGSFPDMVDTYPKIIGAAGVCFSTALLARGAAGLKKGNMDGRKSLTGEQYGFIAVTLAAAVAYVLLIPVIGYLTTTVFFLAAFSFYLDSTSKKYLYVLVAVIFAAVIYLAFGRFLHIPLPKGFLI